MLDVPKKYKEAEIYASLWMEPDYKNKKLHIHTGLWKKPVTYAIYTLAGKYLFSGVSSQAIIPVPLTSEKLVAGKYRLEINSRPFLRDIVFRIE